VGLFNHKKPLQSLLPSIRLGGGAAQGVDSAGSRSVLVHGASVWADETAFLPFPSITVFNGLDEMEYPMMVNDHSFPDLDETFKLTAHEVAHSYFPFHTGCNETNYAWMDEGLTSLFEYSMTRDLIDASKASVYFTQEYLDIQGSERDLPLITSSDLVRPPDYYAIYYAKAVFFYSVLLDQVGEDVFKDILRAFVNRWSGKHPTGYDFILTVYDVYGEDLTWLFRPWFFEFGVVDLGIAGVEITEQGYSVKIVKLGSLPAPVHLLATFHDESTQMFSQPPECWKDNNKSTILEIPLGRKLKQLELIQEFPMDVNPGNDLYKF
jgi:hypothetical protein